MGSGGWTNNDPTNFLFPPGGSLTLPHRLIGPDVPLVLRSFSPDYTWLFSDLWYYDDTQFYFQALVINTAFGIREWITGTYTTLSGVQLAQFADGPGSATPNTIHWGTDIYNTVRLAMDWRTADLNVTGTATWSIDGSDVGRGIKARASSSANPIATTTGVANVAIFTVAGFTFKAGRAYRIKSKVFLSSNLVQRTHLFVSTVSVTGQVIVDYGDMQIPEIASTGYGYYSEGYARNTSGADIVHDTILVFALGTAANPINAGSRNASPSYIEIEDVGTAAAFTEARIIT